AHADDIAPGRGHGPKRDAESRSDDVAFDRRIDVHLETRGIEVLADLAIDVHAPSRDVDAAARFRVDDDVRTGGEDAARIGIGDPHIAPGGEDIVPETVQGAVVVLRICGQGKAREKRRCERYPLEG